MRTQLGVAVALVLLAGTTAVAKEEVWEGTLDSQGVQLRLVLHIDKPDKGDWKATLDSPDQSANGLKVDTIAVKDGMLRFEMKDLGARFSGKVNEAGTEAAGDWSQGGGKLPLTLKKVDRSTAAAPPGKEEIWEGKLAVQAGLEMRLVLHVVKAEKGAWTATFDSPDQGAKGLKVDSVAIEKGTLKFTMKGISAEYSGKLNEAATEAVGEWKQGGQTFPLTLKKTDKASEVRRPQTPKPPFPYREVAAAYENTAGGVKLAGTLTVPSGQGPFPAVIMISGSGAQDRDETLFGHKPFLLIADALTRRGVAVLRVDDRGVGGSTGGTSKSTSEDFAGDVLAGISYLKSRSEIDPARIGLIGHSEGGIIAPMVAARSNDVAFIVLLAGTGLPGDEILQKQVGLISKAMGRADELTAKSLGVQRKLVEVVKTVKDEKEAAAKMRAITKEFIASLSEGEQKKLGNVERLADAQIGMLGSGWFRFFLTFDPRPTLTKVRCPVLALNGEKDLQVPPKENLAEIAKALKSGGNERVTVKELPGLNHLFQTCKTGAPAEYALIEETMAPSALTIIGDWVEEQARAK
jgi:pimeloyl-ACP methyl ester carboxylesterase